MKEEKKKRRKRFKPGVGQIEAVDIFAEAMNLNEEEAQALAEYKSVSERINRGSSIETVDIFAEAMNLNEEEARELAEYNSVSERINRGGTTETVDIFAEAMNLNEEEAQKLAEYESASERINRGDNIETVDIFAEAMNLNEEEAQKLKDYQAGTQEPLDIFDDPDEEEEYLFNIKTVFIKDMIINFLCILGLELLLSFITAILLDRKIIPPSSSASVTAIGASYILFIIVVIVWMLRTADGPRILLIRNLFSYGLVIIMSIVIWASGLVIESWDMKPVSWTFMPMRLLRITVFGRLEAAGNLYSIIIAHFVVVAIMTAVYYIRKRMAHDDEELLV